MDVIKMFWMMLTAMFHRSEFEDKEEFWDWFWEREVEGYGVNVWECWECFKHYATLGPIRFSVRMWFESRFNKKNFGYSWTFGKNGYFINGNHWFVPCDKSFSYGCVDTASEYRNGNPIFAKS